MRSYIKVDQKPSAKQTEFYKAQFLQMAAGGAVEFTMKRGKPYTLEIGGEQFPMFVCLPSLVKEMQTPIYALVTDISADIENA